MNERIKDFGKQAYNAGTGIWPINSQMWYEVYNTTFAELIVRECADIANRQFSAATGLDDRDCLTAHQMKQHFGVKQ